MCISWHTPSQGKSDLAHGCLDFTSTSPLLVFATRHQLLHDKPNAAKGSTNGVDQTRLYEPQYAKDDNGQ